LTGVPFTISLPGSDVYLTRRSPLWRFLALTIASRAIRVIADSPQLLQDLGIRGSVIPYGVPLNQSQGTHHAQAVVVTAGKAIVKTGVPLVQTLDPTIQVLSGLSIAAFRQALTGVDIFVKLSLKDKQGNLEDSSVAVLEAMSAGCAVIVSDLPGYRTFIKDGHNGLLVDPRNHQAVLSAIHILRSSPQLRHQLGQAAQATIAASHTPLQVAQRYLKTIGEPASAQDPALP
jgi:glycosyltransferase involved in cell wall biosynthesis